MNTHPSSALRTTIVIDGASPARRADVHTVTAASLRVWNDFSRPGAIAITRASVPAGRTFAVTLPKHSVSVIVLDTSR